MNHGLNRISGSWFSLTRRCQRMFGHDLAGLSAPLAQWPLMIGKKRIGPTRLCVSYQMQCFIELNQIWINSFIILLSGCFFYIWIPAFMDCFNNSHFLGIQIREIII